MFHKYKDQLIFGLMAILFVLILIPNNNFGARTGVDVWDDVDGDAFMNGNATVVGVINQTLDVPDDGETSTSTTGTLDADTYYFKLTTVDGVGGQSLPTDQFSCTVGNEMVSTSTGCKITWTDVLAEASTRIWMATTSQVYYGYYSATTTSTYYFATSTSLVAGTIPTENTAFLNKIATSSDNWIMSGDLGIGTTSPVEILEIYKDGTSTISIDSGTVGGCIKIKNVSGTWAYCTVAGTTFSCSATSCN